MRAEPVARKRTYRFPASLGACVDRLLLLDEKREPIQRQVDELKAEYAALEEHLINAFPKDKLDGAIGKRAAAQIDKPEYPTAYDWTKTYAYIKRTGSFDLLQKRLAVEACRARWEIGRDIPGVEKFIKVRLKVTRRRR